MEIWRRNRNTTTLLFFLWGLGILHQERRVQVNTIMMQHINSILFYKYGPANEQHTYQSIKYMSPDTVKYLKINRLRWTFHVQRVNYDVIKIIPNLKSDLKMRVRIPKLRWIDGVVEDVRILGVRNWWLAARDTTDVWRNDLLRVDTHSELKRQKLCEVWHCEKHWLLIFYFIF